MEETKEVKFLSDFKGFMAQEGASVFGRKTVYFDRRALICFNERSDAKYYLRFDDNVLEPVNCYKLIAIEAEKNKDPLYAYDYATVTSAVFQHCDTKEFISVERAQKEITESKFISVKVYVNPNTDGFSQELIMSFKSFVCKGNFKKLNTGQKIFLELVSPKTKYTAKIFTSEKVEAIVIEANVTSVLVEIPSLKKTAINIFLKSRVKEVFEDVFDDDDGIGLKKTFTREIKISKE